MKVSNKLLGLIGLLFLLVALIPLGHAVPAGQSTKRATAPIQPTVTPAKPPIQPTLTALAGQTARMKLRFSTLHPEISHPAKAWKFWMDKVTEKTNGRITFEAYWSSALIGMGEVLDGTGKGWADVSTGLWMFDPGKVPLGSFDTNFFFNDPNPATQSKIKRQMFAEIPALNLELARWNLGPAILFAPNAPYDLLTRKPVKTLADLNGMRIGHTPVEFVPAFSKAGAASVISSAQEFYSRLERGLIDGICLNVNIMKIYKLHEVAKYYTTINLNTTALFTLYINADTWKKLSTEDQGVFRDAAKEAEQFYLDGLNKEVADARKLYQDAGIQFYEMPASDTKQWAISLPDVPAEWAKKMEAKGAAGWQIVNRYLELSKKEGWEFPRKWGVR